MRSYSQFKVAIRRRETPFHAMLYEMAKRVYGLSVPVIPGLHRFLYHEWALRTSTWHDFWRVVYYEPMFKAMCKEVGPGFKMYYGGDGVARIAGNLNIHIGSNVTMFDNVSLSGLKIFDDPELRIGDNTYIAPRSRYLVAKSVVIGSWGLIACRIVMDNSGHPIANAAARMAPGGGSASRGSVRPVRVGDLCLLGAGTCIYPGAQVGDGVVSKVGTHVAGEIPPFCLVAGNPGRIVAKLPISEELNEHFGEDRVRMWKEQQAAAVI